MPKAATASAIYFAASEAHPISPGGIISCEWSLLREQLLNQWKNLTARELDNAGANRYRIAALIEKTYGINARLAESYLRNFEHTMPLAR